MPRLKINRKLEPLFTTDKQIICIIGGRGSGKSIGVGDFLTHKMAKEGADIYCLREYQDSIMDSVHRVFADSVQKRLQLDGWEVQENKVIAPNGARTTYKGANRNPDSMQSAQGYKYSWFEEAHRASQSSLDKLLPTILRNPGAKCIFTANPQSSADPFSQRFITPYKKQLDRDGIYEDELHLIIVVNWRDNPWWNQEQENLRKWDAEHLPKAKYRWIWEGDFYDEVENSIISVEWFDACIDAHKKLGFEPTGVKVVTHDPADSGDAKAIAYRHGSVFLDVQENDTGDVNTACDWALNYAIDKQADQFIWDAVGIGLGLKRQVSDALDGKRCQAVMFKGSEGPYNPKGVYDPVDGAIMGQRVNQDAFANQRAQYYWMLRDRMYKTWLAVTKGQYINPDELISLSSEIENMDALRSEVCRIPRKETGNGKITLYSKPDMKRLFEIPSPNMADCLAMSLSAKTIKQNKPKTKHMPMSIA